MTYAQKIDNFYRRHNIGLKRIAAMADISQKRLTEILAGKEPTKTEKHLIDVLDHFLVCSSNGFDFSSEIDYQQERLTHLHGELKREIAKLDPDHANNIENIVKCIETESAYLGAFRANSNQMETVEQAVREIRSV